MVQIGSANCAGQSITVSMVTPWGLDLHLREEEMSARRNKQKVAKGRALAAMTGLLNPAKFTKRTASNEAVLCTWTKAIVSVARPVEAAARGRQM